MWRKVRPLSPSHSDRDLLWEWGSLPSGLVERLSSRYEIDADRRSFLRFRRDRAWRRLVSARQSPPRRHFGTAACRWQVRQRFHLRGNSRDLGREIDAGTLCRIVVLISRAPALIATSADFLFRARDERSFAFISLVMLVCYLIWT